MARSKSRRQKPIGGAPGSASPIAPSAGSPSDAPRKGLTRTVGKAWALTGWVFAVVTWFGGSWFTPRISVTPTFLLDSKSILSTQFEIKNEGSVRLFDVDVAYSPCRLTTSDGLTVNGDCNTHKGRIVEPNTRANKRIPVLRAGETNPVQWPEHFSVGNNVNYVDLTLIISYRSPVWLWLLRTEDWFRFQTVQDASGAYHWSAQPQAK